MQPLLLLAASEDATVHPPSRPAQADGFRFQISGGKLSDSDGFGAISPRNLKSDIVDLGGL